MAVEVALGLSGGVLAVSAPAGMAQHLGLCAIGSCTGGAIAFAMSYRALKTGRLDPLEFAARSAANVFGGIPGGYAAAFYLEPHLPSIPREALFMVMAMVCGVFLVGFFMLVERLAKSVSSRLDGQTLFSWILRLPPPPQHPYRPTPRKKD